MIHELQKSYRMWCHISEFHPIAEATEFLGILIRFAHILENQSTACLIVAKL